MKCSLVDSQVRCWSPIGRCSVFRDEKRDTGAALASTEDRPISFGCQTSRPGRTEKQVQEQHSETIQVLILQGTVKDDALFLFYLTVFKPFRCCVIFWKHEFHFPPSFCLQNGTKTPSTPRKSPRLPGWHVPGDQSGQHFIPNQPEKWKGRVKKHTRPARIRQIGPKEVVGSRWTALNIFLYL